MNSLNCCLLITSSILVLFLLDRTTAAPNKCVFKCLKGVIKCKRDVNVPGVLPPGTDCCALYTECYMGCKPDADSVPSCGPKPKRGSWNKRVPSLYNSGLLGRLESRSEFGLPSSPQDNGYYRDAINFLLDSSADDM